MVIFKSEADLLNAIERHDSLVTACIRNEIGFLEFSNRYDNFYSRCALDGHESDTEEQLLLAKHRARIEPHRVIAQEIFGKLCSDDDAQLDKYKNAGRFGAAEALRRLRNVLNA